MASGVPRWVWSVLVLVHLLALAWTLRTNNWSFPDSERYMQAARNLKEHRQLFARAWPTRVPTGQVIQEYSIRTPAYPVLILGIGGENGSLGLLLIIQNFLSLFVIGIVLKWWAHWTWPQTKQWLWALLCVLTFPAQLIYANAVMSEIALQVMVLAMLAGGLQYIRTRKLIYFLAAAGAGCIALLLKPVFYPFAVVLAVAGIALGWQRRQIGVILIGLLPVLVAGGYMEWNQQRTGYFHFSSIAEINLLHYNAAGVVRELNGPQAEEVWVAGVLHEAQLQPDFGARQRLIQQRASAVLQDHWVVYAKQHVLGMVALFLDPGRFDISEFLDLPPLPSGGLLAQARAAGLWAAVQRLPAGLLSCLAFILLANVLRLLLAARGFWQMRRGPEWMRYGRWLALLLLGYVALLTGPLGAARFLVPVWPVLLGLALVGIKSQPADGFASNAAAVGANV